jgi:tRNA(Ile2) C34 agmatinyltransferase TiaS
VHQSSHGVEAYLGRIFDIRDSYCLDESNLDAFQLYNLKKLGVVAILNKKLYECKNCGNRFEAIGGKKNSIICKKCFKRACQPI